MIAIVRNSLSRRFGADLLLFSAVFRRDYAVLAA